MSIWVKIRNKRFFGHPPEHLSQDAMILRGGYDKRGISSSVIVVHKNFLLIHARNKYKSSGDTSYYVTTSLDFYYLFLREITQ